MLEETYFMLLLSCRIIKSSSSCCSIFETTDKVLEPYVGQTSSDFESSLSGDVSRKVCYCVVIA